MRKDRTTGTAWWLRAAAVAVALGWMMDASADAQTTPELEARIAAYVQQSSALAEAHAARPRGEPYADERARSAHLSAAQRAQAQSLFASAFTVWRAGDYAAAEIGFRQGLEVDPANGAANFYMGDILRRRGANGEAANFMARAVAFAPSSTEGLRAQAALRELGPALDPEIAAPPVIFAPPGEPIVFRDCADCPEMVTIPAGSYTMGSAPSESGRDSDEGPQRRIRIRPLSVGVFEVTFDQWAACVNRGGCTGNANPSDEGWGRGNRPVINVSWNEAQQYVQWISRETHHSYRLLTEAEWEYAARAGANTSHPWGSSASHDFANYGLDRCCDGVASGRDEWTRTAPVGRFPANAFGLYDMIGNVFEWVQDCYAENLESMPADGSAFQPQSCTRRVGRGGSWYVIPAWTRVADRRGDPPTSRDITAGFRVARTL